MNTDQARELLRSVYQQMMAAHANVEPGVDSRLLLTIGYIADVISEALEAERENRKLRVDDRAEYILNKLIAAISRADVSDWQRCVAEARGLIC